MGKPLFFLLYPSLGLLAGWMSLELAMAGKNADPSSHSRNRGGQRESRSIPAPWTGDDFYRRIHDDSGRGTDESAMRKLTAGWTDAEIRAVLDEAADDPRMLLHPQGVAGLLLREYLTRDMDAALAWFQARPRIQQQKLARDLAFGWPRERAMDGLQFVLRNRDLFDDLRNSPYPLLHACVSVESERGLAAVRSLLATLQREHLVVHAPEQIAFAPGFNFAGLLGSGDLQNSDLLSFRDAVISRWRKEEPEAAWRWAAQQGKTDDLLALTKYIEGPTAETLRWFCGRLAELPPAQRTDFFKAKTTYWEVYRDNSEETGGDHAAWLAAMPTAELRQELRATMLEETFPTRQEAAVKLLEEMPDVEARLRMLESLERAEHAPKDPFGSPWVAVLLPQKLEEWGVEETRAAAILQRITRLMNAP